MKWLSTNAASLAMALVLSLVTVGLLTKPTEPELEVTVPAAFDPEILTPDFGSFIFEVDGRRVADTLQVVVTSDPAQITAGIQLTCKPILDYSKFPADTSIRETKVRIDSKDFNLSPDAAKRIKIKPFELTIRYSPMTDMTLPLQVSPDDIIDSKNSRYRIESVRAIPDRIKVRLPIDKAETLTSLPIRPFRMAGEQSSFRREGFLNLDHPDLKDVRKLDQFMVAVELSLIQDQGEKADIPLYLSTPAIPGHRAELIDKLAIKVAIEGPKDIVDQIVQKADSVHVYVKLDWRPESVAGTYTLPVRCELVDESHRRLARVRLAPGEPVAAAVLVTRLKD